jgi:hypothetical protein
MSATRPAHLIFRNLIILKYLASYTNYEALHIQLSQVSCCFLPFGSKHSSQKPVLTLILCYSPGRQTKLYTNIKQQKSILLYSLIFAFLDSKWKTQDSLLNTRRCKQSATTCSRWFLARGFFCPEDGDNKFLRNVGSYKIYTAPHPRRRHSS